MTLERKLFSSTVAQEGPVQLPTRELVEEEKRIATPQQDMMAAIIGWILQGGVLASAAVILFGILLLPFRPGALTLQRLQTFPHSPGAVWAGQVREGLQSLKRQRARTKGQQQDAEQNNRRAGKHAALKNPANNRSHHILLRRGNAFLLLHQFPRR